MALTAFALPLEFDPAGEKNVGNGAGGQFITGRCLSDADCASGCCAVFNGGGICSGPAVSFAQGKQGCGFGGANAGAPPADDAPADDAPAQDAPAGGLDAKIDLNAPGSQNVGKGNGQQFITGQCFANADCATGCCAGKTGSETGACSAVLVANDNGKTGCGFVQA